LSYGKVRDGETLLKNALPFTQELPSESSMTVMRYPDNRVCHGRTRRIVTRDCHPVVAHLLMTRLLGSKLKVVSIEHDYVTLV
jgi:hypothetical protein